jgi:hypothetical protein
MSLAADECLNIYDRISSNFSISFRYAYPFFFFFGFVFQGNLLYLPNCDNLLKQSASQYFLSMVWCHLLRHKHKLNI